MRLAPITVIVTIGLAAVVTLSLAGCGGHRTPRRRHVTPTPRPTLPPPPADDGDYAYDPRPLKPVRWSAKMAGRCRALAPLFEAVAGDVGLEPELLMAVARVESGFRTDVRSHAGARGLMQIMPRTARGLGCGELGDAEASLRCGAELLRRNLRRYEGSLIYALAAYNGGPGYVKRQWAARTLPRNFRYVEKILKTRAFFRRHGCDPSDDASGTR